MRSIKLFACVIGIILLSACSFPKSKAIPVYYYTLDYTPAPLTVERRLPFVVRVERFTATPPFDTQRIIYADKGLYRNAYANFKWIANPGEVLAYALVRDLGQTNAFQAALPPDAGTPPTHTINGWVEEFLEEDYSEPAQASACVTIALIDARQSDPVQRILFQKTYKAKAPCDDKTPAALSKAMSVVAGQINAQIIQDIYARLAQIP